MVPLRVWTRTLWLATLVGGSTAIAAASDLLVVYGAGSTDIWSTELTFANRTSEETSVGIFDAPFDTCPPPAPCYAFATVPPRGTISLEYNGNLLRSGIGAAYLFTGSDPLAVSVQARAHQQALACATVDLPIFAVATLQALNPETLVLGGARRGGGARTNLLVANVFLQDGGAHDVLDIGIEAFAADGSLLGQTSITVPYGESQFVSDVLGTLGATEVDNGQIRITKLRGDSVMWAMMPITRADGSMSISLGAAP